MADGDRVAGIYSEIKYKFDRRSIQNLRKFKRDLMELKNNLRSVQKLSRKNVKIGFTANNAKVTQRVARQSQQVTKESENTARSLGKQNRLRENSLKLQARQARAEKQQRKVQSNAMRGERDIQDRMARNQAKLGRISDQSEGRVTERNLRAAQRAQERYNRKLRDGIITMGQYNRASQNVTEGLRRQGRAAKNTTMSFDRMRTSLAGATGAFSGFAGAVGIGAIGSQFESVEIMLETAMGGQAGETMDFLIEQSQRLGISAADTAKGFARYALAGKQMGFTNEQLREQFLGVTESATVFGLRQDEIIGTVRALEQIASKGQVMAEELKLQLGDRMPAVLQVAAKSMKMTTAEFLKAMEQGEVGAKEFLPVFTKALREMAAPGLDKAFKTMGVAFKRMVQNGKLLINAIFQSGVGELFTQIFNSLTDIFQIMRPIMSFLFGFLSAFIKAVIFPIRLAIALIADLVDMVATGFQNVFGVSLDKVMAKIGNFFGFLASIFSGVFNFVGKIVSGLGSLIGKVSPTMAVARKFPGASETIKQAATKTGEIAGKIGRSTYTKAGGVGAATSEVIGSEAASRVFVEFTGEGKEYLRQNEREKPRTTMSSNIRG